ncbi:MAG: hypothetical protein JXA14_07535 [Anaerolineae bacterium]|nr:hypothetical protein [Anaerolineae bacterium]
MPEATIASFILRFTQEQAPEACTDIGPWRGVIRHVQSNEQAHFLHIEDALAFMSHYVDITTGEPNEKF